jgi:hypothetical protein
MKTKIAAIERRYERCGFAYTDRTRMMFAPKFTVTRNENDKTSDDIVLCGARNHPEPTETDIAECRAAVIAMYPANRLYIDSEEGLIPIFDPNPKPQNPDELGITTRAIAKLIEECGDRYFLTALHSYAQKRFDNNTNDMIWGAIAHASKI